MKALTFILTFCIIAAAFSPASATPTVVAIHQHQLNEFSKLNKTLYRLNETRRELDGGDCDYVVTIKTSCSSPSHTRDQIGLSLGDADGSKIYVPKLDAPDSGRFDSCAIDVIPVSGGGCIKSICSHFLFRSGPDGWRPETVTAYDYISPPITFFYDIDIPEGDGGYGYNYCH
ncbi:PLAT/LH2 domain superfamily [Sesbania bispinosa]|nr:PLAT/LH2 domain superfamily [Sesbania bispinosa]